MSGIVVLGMHRGGTSLTAELIHRWGAYGDTARFLPADAWNAHGYWEYRPLVELNDELLRAVHSSWDVPPAEEQRSRLAELAEKGAYRERAGELLGAMQAGGRPWFWKDPRLSVLLPFWRRIWGQVTYVVPVRNPEDIADSLRRRDGLSLSSSFLLWQRYLSTILLSEEIAAEGLFLSYEGLLENGAAECGRLCRFLDRRFGIQAPAPDPRPLLMAQAIAPELQKSRRGGRFSENPSATPSQKALGRALRLRTRDLDEKFGESIQPEPGWRSQLVAASGGNECRSTNYFQVFWRDRDSGYSEARSAHTGLAAGWMRQSLRVDLPQGQGEPLAALRIDLSQQAGLLSVQELRVTDAFANPVWIWDGSPDTIRALPHQQLSWHEVQTHGAGGVLHLEGDDPWFEIALSPSQASALQGGGSVAMVCAHVSPAALQAQIPNGAPRMGSIAADGSELEGSDAEA